MSCQYEFNRRQLQKHVGALSITGVAGQVLATSKMAFPDNAAAEAAMAASDGMLADLICGGSLFLYRAGEISMPRTENECYYLLRASSVKRGVGVVRCFACARILASRRYVTRAG
jgi:hypothetical protein